VKNLVIVGLGPVGLATGVAFALQGHQVSAVEIDPDRRAAIAHGKVPFYEKGLESALRKVLRSGRFSVAGDYSSALGSGNIAFLCVGTPSRPDGSMDDTYLRSATRSLASAWTDKRRRIVVVKSTVVPGTTEGVVRPILEEARLPYRLAVNPEFLREGRALQDATKPDRVVIGTDSPATARALRSLYVRARCPIFVTDLRTAEAIKYATNAFLATKITFANEMANLCQALGVSYDEVLRGMSLDPRINPRFLVPGVGFGGSCLPKDVRALVAAGRSAGYNPDLLSTVLAENDRQYLRAVELLDSELGDLKGKRIALLGLAFKGGTDDVRESRAVPLAQALLKKGAIVVGYDPVAGPNFARLVPKVSIARNLEDALLGASGCIVQADWPEFSKVSARDFARYMKQPVVVDGRRVLNPAKMKGLRFRRIG